jgi:membrane associated rhomboid family serine protease
MSVEEGLFSYQVTFPAKPLWQTAMTSILAHAGIVHLAGNMLFLWLFGNAMNYKFGHVGYAALFLVGGWLATIIHYGVVGGPVVGASGAIAAVMGAFLVFFPRNDVSAVWIFLPFAKAFTISSGWLLVYFVGWDIFYLVWGADTGVAVAAHVGGFACGFAVAFVLAWLRVVTPTVDEQTLLEVFGRAR